MKDYCIKIHSKEISIEEIEKLVDELARLCRDRYYTWDSPTPISDDEIIINLHLIQSDITQLQKGISLLHEKYPSIIIEIVE